MPSSHRPVTAGLIALVATICVALVALALGSSPASGTPQDVVDAWVSGDVQLATQSDAADLFGAISLFAVQNPPELQPQFAAAVRVRVREIVWGIRPGAPETQPAEIPRAQIPIWMMLAAGGAGALLVAGFAASVWRRSRRNTATRETMA